MFKFLLKVLSFVATLNFGSLKIFLSPTFYLNKNILKIINLTNDIFI